MGIETALLVATIASSVQGYVSDRKAAKAQKRANQAAMQAAEEEARLAREDAEFAAVQEKKEARRIRGQQIASFLRSGVTLDGSPLLVESETTDQGERNAANTLANAESQSKSILLRGKASQQPVQSADIFGTAGNILGATQTYQNSQASKK